MAITDLVPWKRGAKNVPVRREEEVPFYSLQREVNRLFDDFFGSGFGLTPVTAQVRRTLPV
jgi:HSP20 family protein